MYFNKCRKLMSLLILFLSLMLLLSGCRNSGDSAADQVQGRVALIIKPADRTGDAMSVRLSRSGAFTNLRVVTAVPGLPAEEQIRLLSEEGYLMIVASSPDYALDVTIVAPDFPGTVYVIFGAIVEGDNIASVLPDYTGSLKKAGVLAALAADCLPFKKPTPQNSPDLSQESGEQGTAMAQQQQQLTVSFITTAANPMRNEWENAFNEGVARTGKPISVISDAVGQMGNRGQRNTLDLLISESLQQMAYLICIDGSISMDKMPERLGAHNTWLIGIEHDISVLVPGKVIASVIAFPEVILLPVLEDARQKKFSGAVITPSDENGGVGFTNLHGLTICEEEYLRQSDGGQQQQILKLRKTLPWNIEELLAEQLGTVNKRPDQPKAR